MKIIAQFDIVNAKYSKDDSRIHEFYEAAPKINSLAESMPGFIWRYTDENEAEVKAQFGESTLFTLSMWRDLKSLHQFLFKTNHVNYMKRGAQWFSRSKEPRVVLWWVDETYRPSLTEAVNNLLLLRQYGPTRNLFGLTGYPNKKNK